MSPRYSSPRTVAVLGGSGFVGRHLSAELVRQGHSVVIATRRLTRGRSLSVLPGVDLRVGDARERESLKALLKDCDSVVNLIGILNEKGHRGIGFQRAHVEIVESLVDTCAQLGISKIVHVSALGANAERGPSHYLQSKGRAEQILMQQCGTRADVTILRPSVIFGPDDSFINRFSALLESSPVLPLARASALLAPVHVADVAAAIRIALDSDRYSGQTISLCGPESLTLSQIVTMIGERLPNRCLIVPLPDALGRILALVCDYLVPGKPFSLDNFRSLSIANVASETGFDAFEISPRSFSVELRKLRTNLPRATLLADIRSKANRR